MSRINLQSFKFMPLSKPFRLLKCCFTIKWKKKAYVSIIPVLCFQVKIEALNDSRLIGMCLYNVVVLSAVGLTLNLALGDQVTLVYGIQSSILLIGTTSTQLVVFVPKVCSAYLCFWKEIHITKAFEKSVSFYFVSQEYTNQSNKKL